MGEAGIGLKTENRFTLGEELAGFVELIIEYAKKYKTVSLPRNTVLYRARINDINHSSTPFKLEEMGAPPAFLAGHGRLNPRGIPYLYLASSKLTAISEVRPWVGCDVTLAEFNLSVDYSLINFSQKYFVNIPQGIEFEGFEFSWRELITWLFSAPFDPRDDTAYIPSQFLAERIKGAGFDGIIYDSPLSSEGYNVTLFNVNSVSPSCREKARVTSIEIKARVEGIIED